MSNKITISIPTSLGIETFNVSKKSLFSLVFILATALISALAYGYHLWLVEQLNQAKYNALVGQFSQLEVLYEEQLDTTHSLSQELEEKRNQIHVLGKRVYDVESVLGLVDEAVDDASLENRIDAAAVDSAVRATMFRMIPNDSPMNYERISSSFGWRTNPITGKKHSHTGIDLTCKRGEEIYAPADGVVETVRPSKQGFGNFLTVRHSFGFMSSYAHLQKFKVRSGQFVSKGDVIATCGNSGNSTGPHLHYEVRFLGRALNPQYTMDWTPDNFNYLFEKEKKVKWAPLVKLIDNTVRLQINLTNNPYHEKSVDTVKNEQQPSTTEVTVQ